MTANCAIRDFVRRIGFGVLRLQNVIRFSALHLNVISNSFIREVSNLRTLPVCGQKAPVLSVPDAAFQLANPQIRPSLGVPIYRLPYKRTLTELHLIFYTETLCKRVRCFSIHRKENVRYGGQHKTIKTYRHDIMTNNKQSRNIPSELN
jgi:hypothetical protein